VRGVGEQIKLRLNKRPSKLQLGLLSLWHGAIVAVAVAAATARATAIATRRQQLCQLALGCLAIYLSNISVGRTRGVCAIAI